MAVKPAPLRAVKPDEVAPAKVLDVAEAAKTGDHRALLVAMRDRIAEAVRKTDCPPRDLASLTRRLQDISKELEAIDAREQGDDVGAATEIPNEAFDPKAL